MKGRFHRRLRRAAGIAALVLLATVAAAPAARAYEVDGGVTDPFEGFNRTMFEFNLILDRTVMRPLAKGYVLILPQFTRDMIKHFLDNLRTPVVLANDLLQGKLGRAGMTVQRFMINSTFGIGGLFDLAEALGIEGHDEDFGQTLATWGFGEGPYLVLPILGPAPPRDVIGHGVDLLLDPFDPLIHAFLPFLPFTVSVGRIGARALDTRARHLATLDEIEAGSIDFYATVRSLYLQRRDDEIRDGAPPDTIPIPSLSLNLGGDQGEMRVSLLPES